MRFLILGLIFILSCSSSVTNLDDERQLALENWKNHSTSELLDHPYFKYKALNKKKHSDGRETWIFRDQPRYQSSAYCQSLGGCMGIPYYNCDTAFSVKDNVILAGLQNGTCPPAATFEVSKK